MNPSKIIYGGINWILNIVIKMIPLLIVATILGLVYLTNSLFFMFIVATFTFLSVFYSHQFFTVVKNLLNEIYWFIFRKERKINPYESWFYHYYNENDELKSQAYSLLGLLSLLLIIFAIIVNCSFYFCNPNYIKTEISIPLKKNIYEIQHLPQSPSINNFSLRFLGKYKKKIVNSPTLIIDKSLNGSFVIKNNENTKKKHCFIKDLDNYFYNNEFKIKIDSEKAIFHSLYKPPYTNEILKEKIIAIIEGCK